MMADAQLQQLVTSAQTPGDHGKLVEYFTSLATKYSQEADSHAAMAAGYRGDCRGMSSAAGLRPFLRQEGGQLVMAIGSCAGRCAPAPRGRRVSDGGGPGEERRLRFGAALEFSI